MIKPNGITKVQTYHGIASLSAGITRTVILSPHCASYSGGCTLLFTKTTALLKSMSGSACLMLSPASMLKTSFFDSVVYSVAFIYYLVKCNRSHYLNRRDSHALVGGRVYHFSALHDVADMKSPVSCKLCKPANFWTVDFSDIYATVY